MPQFSDKSRNRLVTCEKDLQDLFNEVIKHVDCTILDGHRDEGRQNKAFQEGKSKARYPRSKHNSYPSKAVDVAPYPIDWEDINRFYQFAGFVQGVASQLNISVKWGGEFKDFLDAPHWEI